MPLVTRTAVSGNVYRQDAAPSDPLAGDIWTDTNADLTYRRNDANNNWDLVATSAAVSATEYASLDGVTSALQTQINAKAATSGATLTSCTLTSPTINSPTITTPDIVGGETLQVFTKEFNEDFSGDTLDAKWTKTDLSGTNTAALTDGINEGVTLTTQAAASAVVSLHHNGIRHIDAASFTLYTKLGVNSVQAGAFVGVSGDSTDVGASIKFAGVYLDDVSYDHVALQTGDGSTASATVSDIAIGTGLHTCKIISNGTNVRLWILVAGAWVLKVTKTTNLPTLKAQPLLRNATSDGSAVALRCLRLVIRNNT